MDSITHFSHEHPLHLLKQKPTEEGKECYACEVRLTDEREHLVEVYGCELCKEFFLHKYCAQLPVEIVHKVHQNHSLFLVLRPPGFCLEGEQLCKCEDRCPVRRYNNRFFYYCYLCDFLLDTDCAFRKKDGIVSRKKELVFHHPSHHHQLMVLSRPASFLCDACGVEDKDLSYHCLPCQFGIHKRCATLPSTTTLDIHSHPLTLSLIGLPSHHRKYDYDCDICGGELSTSNNEFWLYYCDLCRYFVHIGCVGKKKPQIEVDLKGLLIDDLPHLPMSDKSVELIQRFLLENNSPAHVLPEISIFSHKHPLVYSNDEFLEEDEEILCDACIEPIFSPPYYHCAECKYFLHLTCAKLPLQLQHPMHSHQLSLSSKTRFDEMFECNLCQRKSNGFFFYCTTEGCEFYLDLSCAALPKVIMHESHNHPLFQMAFKHLLDCRGCGWRTFDRHWIGCIPCDFVLHVRCVLLPKTIKHRYDSKHPLVLRFPPHSYHPKPFDCYQCEREINPNCWLYHCEECDLSFHVYCTRLGWYFSNMKFGQKVQIGAHQHPLKFVSEPSVASSECHHCQQSLRGIFDRRFFECETCHFNLCKRCAGKIEPLS